MIESSFPFPSREFMNAFSYICRQSMNISIKFNQFEREKDLKVVFYDEKVKVHMASGVLLNEWCIEPVIEHYGTTS